MRFHSTQVSGPPNTSVRLVWGHGWGQTGAAFRPLAEAMSPFAPSTLLDLPGFGQTAAPAQDWGTEEYALAIRAWLQEQFPTTQVVWVGHSFGGRVGIQLAAHWPNLQGLVLVAAAGLQRRRSALQQLRFQARKTVGRAAGRVLAGRPELERLRSRVGSTDYRQAGVLRPILTRVVQEDLTPVAQQIKCPTLLIYGRNDTETPPEFGERYHALIPRSELAVLAGFGHLDILNEGRHQVTVLLRRFLQGLE